MSKRTTLTLLRIWLITAASSAIAQQAASDKAVNLQAVTVQMVNKSIAKIGGKATMHKYFCPKNDTPQERAQMTHVESGDKAWVDLAVKMLPFSDASCTTGLQYSLGIAMQHQPRNVLPYVGKGSTLGPEFICVPLIWLDDPLDEKLAQIKRSKAALLAVKDKVLEKPCQICLARVASLEKKVLANAAEQKKK